MVTTTAEWTFRMVGSQLLWDTARQVQNLLSARSIPFAIVGGVAVCLHGYRRTTVDLDILVRSIDTADVKTAFEADQIDWDAEIKEFRTASGIPIQLLISGDKQGPRQPTVFPEPDNPKVVVEREGLSVLSLSALIESKIACGLGNLRRTHKDFADVVELIAANRLTKSFVRHLHPSVRPEFRELVDQASA